MLFSNEEYADIHYIYGYCNGSERQAVVEYSRRFPNRRVPDRRVFARVHRCLRETGSFSKAIAEREPDNDDQEDLILEMIEHNPSTSVRRISNQVGATRMKVWRTLHRFGLYPFHLQGVQALLPTDLDSRMQFCHWLIEHQHLLEKILFTDEVNFNRDDINNTRNSHCWSIENPHETYDKHFQHKFSVNIWCGIINNQLVGPFILEGPLTGEIYLRFLQEELSLLMENIPLRNRVQMWLQHDGAPPHFSRQVTAFLNNSYHDRWIGRGGPVSWPPRSPDLTPLDYFLWGHMKSMVYAKQSHNRDELINRIMDAATQIRNSPGMVEQAVRSLLRRARLCIESAGCHFEQNL